MSRSVQAIGIVVVGIVAAGQATAADPILDVHTPMAPAAWALLERELLRANSEACELFYSRYFDERGWLLCVERWGGDDGPDDAIENCLHWPILHALGGSDRMLDLYKKAWEGHLRQYTLAKTKEVPFARDGMYFREFPVMFDWLHNAEGLTVFCLQGLSDPDNAAFRQRTLRYAGFYNGDDHTAPNYDPKHRLIRSLFNGSRGPLLRKATALDWAGDPIEIEGRFSPGHGERTFQEMLDHFKDYTDIVGDNPENLLCTALAFNAFCITHDAKHKQWLLDYVDAWADRARKNGDILPSNIGLDGTIGGETGGKWYGGTYGWGFTVIVPQTGKPVHRNSTGLGIHGFLNAHLLTGDDRYLDVLRKQIDAVNANAKMIDGATHYPHMFGDKGWYDYTPLKYEVGAKEVWYASMRPADRSRVSSQWIDFLEGKNANYPEAILKADFDRVRRQVAAIRDDASTPDTRLADDSMKHNPCSVGSLVELMCGGLLPNKQGLVLHSRLRYFDPAKRRAGIPDDVAALVEKLTADETVVTLVNVNQLEPRTVTIQGGAYAEHRIERIAIGDAAAAVNAPHATVRLAPGCGARLTLSMKRHSNPPKLAFPW